MKFELLNVALYNWPYDDKDMDKICTQIKGTVYEKRISIVSKLAEYSKRTERRLFIDINSLEELEDLYAIFGEKLILDFREEPSIIIYDKWMQ